MIYGYDRHFSFQQTLFQTPTAITVTTKRLAWVDEYRPGSSFKSQNSFHGHLGERNEGIQDPSGNKQHAAGRIVDLDVDAHTSL